MTSITGELEHIVVHPLDGSTCCITAHTTIHRLHAGPLRATTVDHIDDGTRIRIPHMRRPCGPSGQHIFDVDELESEPPYDSDPSVSTRAPLSGLALSFSRVGLDFSGREKQNEVGFRSAWFLFCTRITWTVHHSRAAQITPP
jgi:hypothetical protein